MTRSNVFGSLMLLWSLGAVAATDDVIHLQPGFDRNDAPLYTWYLQDESHLLQIEDILTVPAGRFEQNRRDIINLGLRGPTIWLRLNLHNEGTRPGDWILSLNRALLDVVDIYEVLPDETRLLLTSSNQESIRDSYSAYDTLAVPIALTPGQAATIYVRYLPPNWSGMPISIQTVKSFDWRQRLELIVYFGMLVAIFASIFYTTIPFVFIGRETFYVYAGAQVALFLLYTHLEGITTIYVFPDHPELGHDLAPLFGLLFNTLIMQFARKFFATDERLPRLDVYFRVLVWLLSLSIFLIALSALVPMVPRKAVSAFGLALPILVWINLPILAVYGTFRWSINFWPLMFAWLGMAMFTIGAQLVWFGIVTQLPFGTNIYAVVAGVEAFSLSTAMMLRVREIQQNRLVAEKRLSESLARELDETNRRIEAMEGRAIAMQESVEKGRLLLTAGHDSRQLISALRNYAAGLKMINADNEPLKEVGSRIEEITEHLDAVLTTAIEGSYDGADDLALAIDYFPVHSLFETLRLIHEAPARSKALRLQFRGTDIRVASDRVLLTRILGNFVSNAIKYSNGGRILVAARPRDGHLSLEVWDTGAGMDQEQLNLLLATDAGNRRFQSSQTGEGAGIGIAQRLAKRLGAEITANTRRDAGSVFRLELPGNPGFDVRRVVHTAGVHISSPGEFSLRPVAGSEGLSGAIVLVDQDFPRIDGGLTMSAGLRPDNIPVLCVYGKTAEERRKFSQFCSYILYKPVSSEALGYVLNLIARLEPGERASSS